MVILFPVAAFAVAAIAVLVALSVPVVVVFVAVVIAVFFFVGSFAITLEMVAISCYIRHRNVCKVKVILLRLIVINVTESLYV